MTAGTDGSFGALKQVDAGVLSVGYAEAGPADGPAVILLHGWPYDIHSYAEVTPAARFGRIPGDRSVPARVRHDPLPVPMRRSGMASNLSSGSTSSRSWTLSASQHAIIGGFDWGARTANVVAALWPGRCRAMVSVSGYLIGSQEAGKAPLPPPAELSWWYQFYFATERGRAGYDTYRREFARLIWHTASPEWDFDDATFNRSATSFDNADHVGIVIHNYRWRIGLAEGEAQYDDLEKQLAASPVISVPTITLEGDANGAPHPEPGAYAAKFSGKYAHRTVSGGVGHNLPQEAPQAFAQAIIDVAEPALGEKCPKTTPSARSRSASRSRNSPIAPPRERDQVARASRRSPTTRRACRSR